MQASICQRPSAHMEVDQGRCISDDSGLSSKMSSRVRVFAASHIIVYIMSTALIVDRATAYWTAARPHVFTAIVTCLVTAHIVGNCLSLALIYRKSNGEYPISGLQSVTCVVMHVMQMGPIWRVLRLAGPGHMEEVVDLNLVRVVMTMLSDAPFIVLQTSLTLEGRRSSWTSIVSIVFTFSSLCYSISFHNIMRKRQKSRNADKTNFATITAQWLSHAFVLGSRFLALAIFLYSWIYWLAGFLVVHCLVTVVSLYIVNEFTREKRQVSVKVLLAWSAQIVEWVEVQWEPSRGDLAVFYSVMGVENFAVGTVFAFTADQHPTTYIIGVMVILAFVIGVGIKMVAYRLSLSGVTNKTSDHMLNEICNKRPQSVQLNNEVIAADALPPSMNTILKQPVSPRRVMLYETKQTRHSKDIKLSKSSGRYDSKDISDTTQPSDPVSVDDSGFYSKTDDSIMAMSSDLQIHSSKHKAEVHVSPAQPIRTNRYSSFDDINVTISEFEMDFTDTSKILPASTPKAKLRDQKTNEHSDKGIRRLQESYHEQQADQTPAPAVPRPGRPKTDLLKTGHSVSSRSSVSCTRARSCTDTCCDLCDYISTSLTSSSDIDSFSDIDFTELDLTKTWPPSRKLTIENLGDLPKTTLSSHEHVKIWLSKSFKHVVEEGDPKRTNTTSTTIV